MKAIGYFYLLLDEIDPPSQPLPPLGIERFSITVTERLVIFVGVWPDQIPLQPDFLQQYLRPGATLEEALFGSAVILLGPAAGGEDALRAAEEVSGRSAAFDFELTGGRLSRLGDCREWDRAWYFYQAGVGGELATEDQIFLLKEFPKIEAQWSRVDNLAEYYADQGRAINTEKRELDIKLSGTLHERFVPRKNEREAMGQLELAVEELSSSYGKLAGNYRLVREGHLTLADEIQTLRRQLLKNPGMAVSTQKFGEMIQQPTRHIQKLRNLETDLRYSLSNYQAGLNVVRSRIDLVLSKKSVELQGQSLTMQFAAGFIEFIIIDYYVMALWKAVAADALHAIPALISFLLTTSTAAVVVYLTHLLAEKKQGEEVESSHLWLAGGALALILAIMAILTILAGH